METVSLKLVWIKVIVKKRTDFEYRIKAKIPHLPDFLRYIQYEVNLERLRVKRKERLTEPVQPSASDVSSNRRISFIFDRALRKFGLFSFISLSPSLPFALPFSPLRSPPRIGHTEATSSSNSIS